MKDWVTIYSNRTRPSLAPARLESRDAETAGLLLHPGGANSRIHTTEDAYYEEDASVRDHRRRFPETSAALNSRTR
jgi:hypothetical protein